jgi:hypothetical protein
MISCTNRRYDGRYQSDDGTVIVIKGDKIFCEDPIRGTAMFFCHQTDSNIQCFDKQTAEIVLLKATLDRDSLFNDYKTFVKIKSK